MPVGCASAHRLFAFRTTNNRCAEAHPTPLGLHQHYSLQIVKGHLAIYDPDDLHRAFAVLADHFRSPLLFELFHLLVRRLRLVRPRKHAWDRQTNRFTLRGRRRFANHLAHDDVVYRSTSRAKFGSLRQRLIVCLLVERDWGTCVAVRPPASARAAKSCLGLKGPPIPAGGGFVSSFRPGRNVSEHPGSRWSVSERVCSTFAPAARSLWNISGRFGSRGTSGCGVAAPATGSRFDMVPPFPPAPNGAIGIVPNKRRTFQNNRRRFSGFTRT